MSSAEDQSSSSLDVEDGPVDEASPSDSEGVGVSEAPEDQRSRHEMLLQAIGCDEVQSVKGHIKEWNDASSTPLIAAAVYGSIHTTEWLISDDAPSMSPPVNGADANGYTALHMAAHSGEAGVLSLLIASGGDVHAVTRDVFANMKSSGLGLSLSVSGICLTAHSFPLDSLVHSRISLQFLPQLLQSQMGTPLTTLT